MISARCRYIPYTLVLDAQNVRWYPHKGKKKEDGVVTRLHDILQGWFEDGILWKVATEVTLDMPILSSVEVVLLTKT
jgi:hypothetical protein